jgi:hypothetical protein
MEKRIDKTDGVENYSMDFVENCRGWVTESKNGEMYTILLMDAEPIERDSRKRIIWVQHRPKKGKFCELNLMADYKNHKGKSPYHINLSGDSKKIQCEICKKYFGGFNHFPIKFKNGTKQGKPYKIVDTEGTFNEIIKKLEVAGFFKEFKPLKRLVFP